MSKKYDTSTITLIIVESPAKCKKIEEYLGSGYKCIASFGHLRELSSLENIDFSNNFHPKYTIIENALKKKQIETIKTEIAKATNVILATDDDREGEAIAWHICDLFNLNVAKTPRIIFHEITENAIITAMRSPKRIDMDVVHSQQARQILDLLIGFKISSNLREYINKYKNISLSAGRCQTPALKIIYDNYLEIKESRGTKMYKTTGIFTNQNIVFSLQPEEKFTTEREINIFLLGASLYQHTYNCSDARIVFRKQPEPFITSTIQQKASAELHLSPKETMSICQKLYETGYITYMRTDNKKYSPEFINGVKEYIFKNYNDGEKYINSDIDLLAIKTIDNLRQEPHEAIRPTNIHTTCVTDVFSQKEKNVYKLIWETSLESCMSNAQLRSITAKITSHDNTYFSYTSETTDFLGWLIVNKKYTDDSKNFHYLSNIKQNTCMAYKKIVSTVVLKHLRSHYTEAKLVQLLEEKGIGRPSTFSSIVDKIQERGYVKKENISGVELECKDFTLENGEIVVDETMRKFGNETGKLVIQQLGVLVIDFLNNKFNALFDYNYTKQMENDLDDISRGENTWHTLCKKCNDEIDELIQLNGKHKLEIKIDENTSYVIGKFGPVLKCNEVVDNKDVTVFKPVKKNIDIHKLNNGEYSLCDVVDSEKSNKEQKITQVKIGTYETHDVILHKGKFGLYITWNNNSKALKELGNRPIESIKYEEIEKYLSEGSNIIRNISENITIRKGTKGFYIFYKTSKMKSPAFYHLKDCNLDYKSCDIDEFKAWINKTHNIK